MKRIVVIKILLLIRALGVFTVSKGLKKGRYKISVKVTAKGNKDYLHSFKTSTVKIIVG